MFIVIAKRQRDTLILGSEKAEKDAIALAQDSVITGTVAECHVFESVASFFESTVNRANPETDNSLATEADREAPHALNGEQPPKTVETDSNRPEVTAKDVQNISTLSTAEKNKIAPKG